MVGQGNEQRDRTESRSTIPELLRAEIEAAADAEMCVHLAAHSTGTASQMNE